MAVYKPLHLSLTSLKGDNRQEYVGAWLFSPLRGNKDGGDTAVTEVCCISAGMGTAVCSNTAGTCPYNHLRINRCIWLGVLLKTQRTQLSGNLIDGLLFFYRL